MGFVMIIVVFAIVGLLVGQFMCGLCLVVVLRVCMQMCIASQSSHTSQLLESLIILLQNYRGAPNTFAAT